MHSRLVLIALLGVAWARPAIAQQRPLVTEDPESIGGGRVLIEAGLDRALDQVYPVSGLRGDLWRVPTFGISIGISPIAEIQIDGGLYSRLSITGRQAAPLSALVTATGSSTHDVEDIVIATKIRLAPETTGRPAFGFRFGTKLPNASNESGLGTDTTDFLASLLVGKTVRVGARRRQRRRRHPCRSHPGRPPERRDHLWPVVSQGRDPADRIRRRGERTMVDEVGRPLSRHRVARAWRRSARATPVAPSASTPASSSG